MHRILCPSVLIGYEQTASIASGAAVSIQTENGLGRDISLLTTGQIVAYRKVRGWILSSIAC